MKSTTKVYDEAASRADKKPLFVLEFLDLGFSLISWLDDSMPCRWDLIEKVSSWSGNIKPNEGSADVSSLTVRCIDDERLHQVAPEAARNSPVRLTGGFEGMFESDFAPLITGLVEDWSFDPESGIWTIRINDLQYYKVATVFRNFGKTRLDGAIVAGDAIITADSTDGSATGDLGFRDPAAAGTGLTYAIMIDDEIIVPTAKDGDNVRWTGCARGQYTQCGGSAAAAHDDNAEVREIVIIEANPVDILLRMMCSTGSGTNGAYDDWAEDEGVGIDQSYIDISTFELERDRFLTTDVYRFALKEPIDDFKKWSEEQIYRTVNAYPIVTGDGTISFRLYNLPFGYDPEDLADGDVITLRDWRRNLGSLINNTQWQYDYSITDNEAKTSRFDLKTESINVHGLSKTWKVESKGIYTDLQADSLIARRITRLFQRYQNGAPSFWARVFFDKFKWDPGDILDVTLSAIPDIATGVMGLARKYMEVITWRPDPDRGTIDCEIMDTRLEGYGGMICPDDFPTYELATAAQRRWAYIAATETGLMPNGDEPAKII